jgi:hypothetical protein
MLKLWEDSKGDHQGWEQSFSHFQNVGRMGMKWDGMAMYVSISI